MYRDWVVARPPFQELSNIKEHRACREHDKSLVDAYVEVGFPSSGAHDYAHAAASI